MDQCEHEASEYLPQNPQFEWKFASNKSNLEKNDTDCAPNQPRHTRKKIQTIAECYA